MPSPDIWKKKFLDAVAIHGNVSKACRVAGVGRSTPYMARDADPDFAAAWDEAKETGVDRLEEVAHTLASEGSERMLIFLLKAHRRAVYGDKAEVEHRGPNGGPLKVQFFLPYNGRDGNPDDPAAAGPAT